DATEDDLYEAMDWLLERQSRIEHKLAARHLVAGVEVVYDVTRSYSQGRWSKDARCRSRCSMNRIWLRLVRRSLRANGSSLVIARCWPRSGRASARRCSRRLTRRWG